MCLEWGCGRDREWPLLVTSETARWSASLFRIARPVAWELLHFDLTEKGRLIYLEMLFTTGMVEDWRSSMGCILLQLLCNQSIHLIPAHDRLNVGSIAHNNKSILSTSFVMLYLWSFIFTYNTRLSITMIVTQWCALFMLESAYLEKAN